MNIKCNYCGSEFDETLEKCPNCGASNANVKRSVIDQPKTIEELKEWYSDKKLPPYETTRFFIGIDYKGPRAFGIYKDENSGKCVVYKNKDTGVRAIRYEGTDEAYAVNELFMRLKQEILQQKARNIENGNVPQTKEEAETQAYLQFKKEYEYAAKRRKTIFGGVIVLVIACLVFGIFSYKAYMSKLYVYPGYYEYSDNTYYHLEGSDLVGWLTYDPESEEWLSSGYVYETPLVDKIKSRQYFVSADDYSSLGCSDARDSDAYKDVIYGHTIHEGYYLIDNKYYYHEYGDNDLGWFVFNKSKSDWDYISARFLPEELRHQYSARDYVYDIDWDNETLLSDPKKSEAFKKEFPQKAVSYPSKYTGEGYYKSGDDYYYHDSLYSGRGWYFFSTDKNDWEYTTFVPDDVSSVDYPTTSVTDITNSSAYIHDHSDSSFSNSDNNSKSDSWWSSSDSSWDSDSSWSWSSSDSWDSGSTDWGSDW